MLLNWSEDGALRYTHIKKTYVNSINVYLELKYFKYFLFASCRTCIVLELKLDDGVLYFHGGGVWHGDHGVCFRGDGVSCERGGVDLHGL